MLYVSSVIKEVFAYDAVFLFLTDISCQEYSCLRAHLACQ